MYLLRKYKGMLALILSIAIVLSGVIITDFPTLKGDFLQFGVEAKAETSPITFCDITHKVDTYYSSTNSLNTQYCYFKGTTLVVRMPYGDENGNILTYTKMINLSAIPVDSVTTINISDGAAYYVVNAQGQNVEGTCKAIRTTSGFSISEQRDINSVYTLKGTVDMKIKVTYQPPSPPSTSTLQNGTISNELVVSFVPNNNPYPSGTFIVDNSRYTYWISYSDYVWYPELYSSVAINGSTYKIFNGNDIPLSLPNGYNNYQQITFSSGGPGLTSIYRISSNNNPYISMIKPTQNVTFSEVDTSFIPQMSVSDADNDTLTCKYYIDSETTPRDIKTVSNTITAQTISFNAINMNILSEGNHTIKFEVNDGKMATPVTIQAVNFIVDKSNPVLGTVTNVATINNITLSGSASDNIAGLDTNPYRYTIGSEVSSWTTGTSYTSQNNLIPNTQYTIKFEARDSKGHIASSSQNIYTKAAIPILSATNASSYTLDVVTSDNNSAPTQYQISVNNGTQYVTQEGTLTATPVWITLTGKKVTVTGLIPSKTYTFNAKARNGESIETAVSSPVSGTTLVAPPGSPANIIATSTDKTITVSWDAVSGAIGYDIEVDGATANTGTATTYTHVNLSPGTPHTYKVRAKNAGGPGNWSASISKSTLPGSPDIPTNLNAIPLSTSITVTWSNVPGATGYDIEVDGVLVNNGPNTNYIQNSLTPGTHHSYRVRSINPGGKSDWSGYVNTTTQLDTVPVPVNITAVPAQNNIALSWNSVNGASGYDIEVDGVTFDNSVRTTYTHINLAPGTQHIYRIRSKKGGINSDWSAAVVSSTIINAFGIPVNFKANANDSSVSLSWDPVPEAVGYDLEIDGVITDSGTETTCIHNGLLTNSSHTYRVRARSATETSEWTLPVAVTIFAVPTPTNVTAISDDTSITITWDPVNGATSYDIDFDGSIISNISTTENSTIPTTADYTIPTTVDSSITTITGSAISATTYSVVPTKYSVMGLTPNTQHVIKVRAVNDSGISNWSTPLTQSTQFTMGNVPIVSGVAKKTSIVIMWNTMDGATSYDVEADGVITSNINGSTFTATVLTAGTKHEYRVRANNISGIGNWSNTFTVSTLPQGPSTPSKVETSSNMTSILVTWDKVVGANEYEVEIDGNVINNGAGTSYLHTGLNPNTSHTYKVRSKNISGNSEWSTLTTANTISSVQTYNIDSIADEEFDLILSASNIQDLNKYTFTIQYNTDDFDVIDLCGLTVKTDTQEGDISSMDITVKQLVPGTIVFIKTGSAQSWQVWSGIVNSIKFKSKHDGQSTITYTIQ
jgi:hypothetical protein